MKLITKYFLALTIIIYLTIKPSLGSYPFFGNCVQHPVVRNFNMTRYLGVWYEIDKYFSFSEVGTRCTSYKYVQDEKGHMHFFRTFLSKGTRTSISGQLEHAGKTKNGRLETLVKHLGDKHSRTEPVDKDSYWILDTDYGNYSVVWSCKNHGIMNLQDIKILCRTRNPTNYIRGLAYGVLKSHGLITKLLFATDQEDCPNLFRRKPSNSLNDEQSRYTQHRSIMNFFG